jgi:hypothetical protein
MKPPLDMPALFPELALITNDTLRAGVVSVWQELWQASQFDDVADVPSSTEIVSPHVPHNRAVLTIALAVADVFERFHGVSVDRDTLIAAGLLQDVSKLVEYRPDDRGGTELTELGERFPHAFWGAHVALRVGVPDSVVQIVLSHTPDSATFPTSLEGKILYYADQLDVIAIFKDRWRKELFITK